MSRTWAASRLTGPSGMGTVPSEPYLNRALRLFRPRLCCSACSHQPSVTWRDRAATTTTADGQRRCHWLLIAWADGDRLALNAVLAEVMRDPTGTSGLIFSLTDYAARLSAQGRPRLR
jgi:hypothetical protein